MTKQKLIGSSITLALVVGCVFGVAIDNLAIGIGIGMLFGVAYAIPVSVAIGRNKKEIMEQSVGVGPHEKPWPIGDQYDPQLLEEGDRRNVEDKYRYWTVEAIKADLDMSRTDLHVAIENWQHDMNIGTIVRNANAFNAGAVHIIGKRHWNRRGAMVTDRYLDIYHHESVEAFVAAVGDRHIIAVDNLDGAVPLSKTTLPEKAVLVFGGEGPGLSKEMQEAAEMMVMIEQLGSTRSVNVGVASGIMMYAWLRQYVL